MKDIIVKRNDLMRRSKELRVVKFDDKVNKDQVAVLIKEQDKIYKKWKFYNEVIKALRQRDKNL